jgi:phosphopentomutase
MLMKSFDRVILIVLDSVGIGEAADAAQFGDAGSHTLGHIANWFKQNGSELLLPNLNRWGLSNLSPKLGPPEPRPEAAHAIMMEISPGKDTTTGHWEIAGSLIEKPFPTFPQGYPQELLNEWCTRNNLPGYLGNKSASGVGIIDEFGEEHRATGKPIVYTSADSVLQIACNEESFGLERLYEICNDARKLVDPLQVGRVIARPFVGKNKKTFKRTEHRKDFSLPPPTPNMLDLISGAGLLVAGVGKIKDIFAYRSVELSNPTGNNEDSMDAILEFLRETKNQRGLIFANLIDFDMHYGHRRDPKGYGDCLMRFDQRLPELEKAVGPRDLVIITADHGNDPTYKGTDHTRENVPLFVWAKGKSILPLHLGLLRGFGHVARLCLEALGLRAEAGKLPCAATTESLFRYLRKDDGH